MGRKLHITLAVSLFLAGLAFVLLSIGSEPIGKFRWQLGAYGFGAMALGILQAPFLFKASPGTKKEGNATDEHR